MSEVAGRVLDLLEQVVTTDTPLGVVDLAGRAGLDKSTASRMLSFLAERQLVVRSPDTQRFDVGPAMLILASAALKRSRLPAVALPFLVSLRDASGETVGLHLRVGHERVCIDGIESPNDIRSAITPGERRPLYLGASGRVMLAFLPAAEREHVLRAARKAGVPALPLEREVGKARAEASLCAISARIPGLAALSVPIFDALGVVGAVTISGPVDRWSMSRMRGFVEPARDAARRISLALGGSLPEAASPGRSPRPATAATLE